MSARQSTDRKLAIVSCHFNWTGSANPVRNLHRFIRNMNKDGVPVYGVEIHLKGQPARMKGHPNWKIIQCNERCILFQKEVLMTMAVDLVPPEYTKIAWIDADLFFDNPNWADETELALDKHPFVQPFEECCWTGQMGGVIVRRPSVAKVPLDSKWISHPGFAWAANRDFFEKSGLYKYCIIGSGDTIFACAVQGRSYLGSKGYGTGIPNLSNGVVTQWRKGLDKYRAGRKCGYVKGRLYHDYHGSLKDRKYVGRASYVVEYDALKHSFINKDGLIEWTDEAPPEMVGMVKSYFTERNEDAERT